MCEFKSHWKLVLCNNYKLTLFFGEYRIEIILIECKTEKKKILGKHKKNLVNTSS